MYPSGNSQLPRPTPRSITFSPCSLRMFCPSACRNVSAARLGEDQHNPLITITKSIRDKNAVLGIWETPIIRALVYMFKRFTASEPSLFWGIYRKSVAAVHHGMKFVDVLPG